MAPKHTFPAEVVSSTVPFVSTAGNLTDRNTFGNPLIVILWFAKDESELSSNVRHWSAKKNRFEIF